MTVGRNTHRRRVRAAVAALAFLTTACIGVLDIFAPSMDLPGGFRLEQFESTHYYIHRGTWIEPGGVLRGEIGEIGWNEHHIVAWRSAMRGSEKSGWMVIDVGSGAIEGPFSGDELRDRMARDDGLRDIRLRSVKESGRAAELVPEQVRKVTLSLVDIAAGATASQNQQ
jgi:hypothetical protein